MGAGAGMLEGTEGSSESVCPAVAGGGASAVVGRTSPPPVGTAASPVGTGASPVDTGRFGVFPADSVVVGAVVGTVGPVVTDGVGGVRLATQPLATSIRHSAPPAMMPLPAGDGDRALFIEGLC